MEEVEVSTDVETAVGTFVWHENISNDPDQAKAFYTQLFGWEIEVFKPGEMDYSMIKSGGTTHGGFMKPQEDIPPHWLGHLLAKDVDETIGQVEGAGGKILFGPMDIPEVGRFGVIADPQGAAFSLFASAGDDGPQSGGVFVWDELHTSDVDGAKSFYGEVFGWTATDRDMGPMTYTIFERGEKQIAGCAPLQEGMPTPYWIPYIYSEDVKATVAQAKELGANVFMDAEEVPTVGWIAVLQDPVGAVFGVFKPSGS